MDITPYLSFDVLFDFTAYPTLVVTDTSTLPSGTITGVWGTITMPDGITTSFGSAANETTLPITVPLRLGSDQLYLAGQYAISMYMKSGVDVGYMERVFEMTYQKGNLVLKEDFDLFTPKLTYSDITDYSRPNFTLGTTAVSWTALVGVSGALGTITATTNILDLLLNGQYYATTYDISFSRSLLYQHQTYTWLTVRDAWAKEIVTEAKPLPTIQDMVNALNTMLTKVFADDCCCDDNKVKNDYILAQSLLQHIVAGVNYGYTDNLNLAIQQFITITNTYTEVVNNTILVTYNTTYITGGGKETLLVNVDITQEISEIIISDLIGKQLTACLLDGIERKFIEGADGDTPDSGTFVFVVATGKLIYGGTMEAGQWLKIKYKIR